LWREGIGGRKAGRCLLRQAWRTEGERYGKMCSVKEIGNEKGRRRKERRDPRRGDWLQQMNQIKRKSGAERRKYSRVGPDGCREGREQVKRKRRKRKGKKRRKRKDATNKKKKRGDGGREAIIGWCWVNAIVSSSCRHLFFFFFFFFFFLK